MTGYHDYGQNSILEGLETPDKRPKRPVHLVDRPFIITTYPAIEVAKESLLETCKRGGHHRP